MIKIEGYEILDTLHTGIKTNIYRGRKGNTSVIIKALTDRYPTDIDIFRIKKEADILKQFNHSSIVKLYDTVILNGTTVLIEEDINASSLDKIFLKPLSTEQFLDIAIKLVKALNEIHSKNIIHKDIKPHNIIYHQDKGNLQIIDFGSATHLSKENPTIVHRGYLEGTLSYISPEQTGRMNRNIDYRTDFYSLGVTFYQLLTGSLPFNSKDPAELVHGHIAKKPVPLTDKGIPRVISDIIMKLLEKNPEDRYQSAEGLLFDLTEFQKRLSIPLSNVPILGDVFQNINFEIGKNDISSRFQIPDKLYGRESELNTLQKEFYEAINGNLIAVLVSGYSGIGKTALINEIQKPLTKHRGFFISGKFDKYKQDTPFFAITQAFRNLCEQLMAQTESSLLQYKNEISKVLGINGKVITDVIPQLESILGDQPPVPELSLGDSQNRFNLVFQDFVQALCTESHPLVLFLDDLQWADSSSLNFLKTILTSGNIKYLYIILSYRSNEVDTTHPFSILLEDTKKLGIKYEHIFLQSITPNDVNNLVSDTLHASQKDTEALSKIIYSKTEGNPFFVTELLRSLYKDDLVYFDKTWKWDIEKINKVSISDNVLEHMRSRLQLLPNDKQEILKLAACIGNWLRKDVFVRISELSPQDVEDKFAEIANEGYISIGGNEVRFAHDKVREAMYTFISDADKAHNHYKIGKTYLALCDEGKEDIASLLFTIVAQLNKASSLMKDEEKKRLLELNLLAGKKAKASTAYEAALNFLKEGVNLLTKDKWEKNYKLTLEIYKELAECEYLLIHFQESDKLFQYILENAKTIFDKIPVIHIQIRQKANEYKPAEAFQIGFNILEELGVKMPDLNKPETVMEMFMAQLGEYKQLLGERPIPSLYDLPNMTDPNILEAISLITNLGDIAISSKPEMLGLMSIMGVTLSLKYGNTNVSPISYVMWGVITNLAFKDYQSGYELGQLGVRLNQERFPSDLIFGKLYAFYGWNIHHFRHHTKIDMEIANKGYETTMANSDLIYAVYFTIMLLKVSFNIGNNLDEVVDYGRKNQAFGLKYKQVLAFAFGDPTLMTALALQGKTESPTSFNTSDFKEEEHVKKYSAFGPPMAYYYLRKFQLYYLFGEYQKCLDVFPDLEKYFPNMPTHIAYVEYYFYKALLYLSLEPATKAEEKKEREEKFNEAYNFLKVWAEQFEDNFLNLFLLVEAEKARVEGKYFEAEQLFEQSIESAKKYDYTNIAAIANELAAKFYLSKGLEKLALIYLRDAHYLYNLWGASAKAKHLIEIYPNIFRQIQLLLVRSDVKMSVTVNSDSTNLSDNTTTTTSNFLDLNTVIKASQTISGEIQLGKLLERMMKILFENAGAERGFFILKDKDKFYIEAEGNSNIDAIEVLKHRSLEDYSELSPNIVNYVTRTKGIVLLNDAVKIGMFINDYYVKEKKPKSVMCYPILNQGNLLGAVYLENNLTTDAFTPDRVEVLKILSSQIAVSIENSLLYANLEEKVKERTRDLNQALTEVSALKEQQDGDYFLNTLLIEPLSQCNAFSKIIHIESFIKQKKNFIFRRNEYELGGDINISENIELKGKKYIVFLNGDAMGKSIQGAGGVLVLGTVFKSIIQRTISTTIGKNLYPERWLKNAFIEMHKTFEAFDGTMLMSIAFGLIDEATGTMYFMNAEHPNIVLYRDGVPTFILPTNEYRKLGTQGQIGHISIDVVSLLPEDIIILGSDGRDDLILGKESSGNDIINQDETLFLQHVKNGNSDLEKIFESILKTGKLMDDLSLLKIHFKGKTSDVEKLKDDMRLLEKYKSESNYNKIAELGQKLISDYPHLTNFLYDTAFAYKALGKYEDSIDFAERLRLRDSKNTSNLLNLIESYNNLGQTDKALAILEICLKEEPEDVRFQKLKTEFNL